MVVQMTSTAPPRRGDGEGRGRAPPDASRLHRRDRRCRGR
jgi:hypothetical protein